MSSAIPSTAGLPAATARPALLCAFVLGLRASLSTVNQGHLVFLGWRDLFLRDPAPGDEFEAAAWWGYRMGQGDAPPRARDLANRHGLLAVDAETIAGYCEEAAGG